MEGTLQNSGDMALGVIAALVYFVVLAGVYVWTSLALSKVFAKLGVEGWKAWVPLLNTIEVFKLGGYPAWNVVWFFVPIAAIYGFVLWVISLHRINLRFGKEVGMTVLAALVFPVWATIIGFGSAEVPTGTDRRIAGAPWGGEAQPAAPSSLASPFGSPAASATSPVLDYPASPAPPAYQQSAPPVYQQAAPPAYQQAPPVAPPPVTPQPVATPPAPEPVAAPAPAPAAPAPAEPAAPEAPPAANPWAAPGTSSIPAAPAPQPATISAPPPVPAPEVVVAPVTPPEPVLTPTPPPAAEWQQAPAPAVADSVDPAESDPSSDSTVIIGGGEVDLDEDERTIVVNRTPVIKWHLVTSAGERLPLIGEDVVLGRKPTAADGGIPIAVPDPTKTLSRVHARLTRRDDEWTITDLNATNGVLIVDAAGLETELPAGSSAVIDRTFVLGEVRLSIDFDAES